MREIRLEIPLDIWENLSSNRIWLKVTENKIEPFEDRGWTKPIPKSENNVIVYADVPKELSLIEVIGLGGLTPVDDISMGWCMDEAIPNWRLPGLKKVTIIMDDLVHEVPVVDEKPDRAEWEEFSKYLYKSWAMEVYTINNETIAAFHWHPNLIEESSEKVRKIQLSKRNKLPCMWEKGGLESEEKGGSARIICRENGEKIKPIFINKGKKCICAEHALIVVREGNVVIDAIYQKDKIYISIFQIKCIHLEYCEAELHYLARFSWRFFNKEKKRTEIRKEIAECSTFIYSHWHNGDIAEKYKDAILAAFDKATHYKCRAPHFIVTE